MGDVDCGFGRAITVVQLHVRQLLKHPVTQFTRQRFAAGEQPTQAAALLRQRFIDEQLQQRRHEMQRGHAIFVDQLRDAMRVAVFAGAGQQQAATGDQRPETFPDRHIEADGCLLHQHVGFVQRISGLHPLQALGQCRVGVADAFGLAGGTRGVNHVGQVVAMQVQARRADRPVVQVQRVHRQRADALGTRQIAEQMALGQQQFNAAVLQHVGQSLNRVIRVQRHVRATGLEDCQQTDQQLWRTLGGNRHLDVRADALVTQVMRQTISLGMQAGEIEAAALPHQRNALGSLQCLTLHLFRQPALRRRAGGSAPVCLFGQFVSAEQLQVAQRDLRLLADLGQQLHIVPGQTHDGVALEQLVGVVEGQVEATVTVFLAVQLQVELGLAAVPRQLFGEQPRQPAQGA